MESGRKYFVYASILETLSWVFILIKDMFLESSLGLPTLAKLK